MAQAQLVTDPALRQVSVQSSDILVGWRPITDATTCQVTGYQPYNITASDFAASILNMGLGLLGPMLPTTAPEGGGWWLDDGALSYSATSGVTSGVPMSPKATAASIEGLLAASPAMGSATNFNGFQNNAGVATQVDDGK